ncbi:hypothetical protein TrRE_jg3811 [Triparma retinervis]|uniref:CSC1/OSCA1-like cytosolic domain-containing protein n=1 Tax=Triparma retinervis TaxID=2557542 RepID=A0A9W7DTX7_9STRA|nr:hypothetical protein TrRE_jg3811 [Triparma retinervis]
MSDIPTTAPEEESQWVDTGDDEAPPPTYEKPSIERAWQFYESNLPRRIKVSKGGRAGVDMNGMLQLGGSAGSQQSEKGTGYRLARPGETHDPVSGEPARLYDVWNIFAFQQLDEFGIGISLYFRQLLLLFVVIGVCAGVNLMTIMNNVDIINSRREDCPSTLLGSVYGAVREDLKMSNQGNADIATCIILAVFVLLLKRFEDANIENIDLAQQTPQDYSIRVRNLPKNITNPDYYHKFFSEKWGDVVFVSLALDNGPLLKVIAEGRELDEVIDAKRNADAADILSGKSVLKQSDLTPDQVGKQKFGMYVTAELLQERKKAIQDRVAELTKPTYKPVCLYVTFNSERSQRSCLNDCATGLIEEWTGCSNNMGQIDGHVLKIDEPVEPSEVIYENLHLHWFWQYWGIFKAYCLTCCILLASFYILQSLSVSVSDAPSAAPAADASESGNAAYVAAIAVSLINGALPYTLKVITLKLEVHKDEGDVQTSILRKLMVARCLNTAVLMYVVTSHNAQFSKANLGQVQSILIADCLTTPVMRILNVYEHIMHRVVAPTKKTQAQMNVLFRGAYWNLAERYTDMVS